MATVAFHHVSLSCRDPLAVERWYSKHFDFKRSFVADIGGGEQIVYIKSGDVYLELFHAEADESPAPTADGPHGVALRHLAFKVDDVDAKLKAMGDDAKITLGPMGFDAFIPGWRTVWVADPDGRVVEISQGYVDQKDPPPLK